jgi:hypothetical protein
MICRAFLKFLYVPAGDIQLHSKGGAILIDQGAVEIYDSAFENNQASDSVSEIESCYERFCEKTNLKILLQFPAAISWRRSNSIGRSNLCH